jgi:hypothetical protein
MPVKRRFEIDIDVIRSGKNIKLPHSTIPTPAIPFRGGCITLGIERQPRYNITTYVRARML